MHLLMAEEEINGGRQCGKGAASNIHAIMARLHKVDMEVGPYGYLLPHNSTKHRALQKRIANQVIISVDPTRHLAGSIQSRDDVVISIQDAAILVDGQSYHAIMKDWHDRAKEKKTTLTKSSRGTPEKDVLPHSSWPFLASCWYARRVATTVKIGSLIH
jgi:hypothetical protein